MIVELICKAEGEVLVARIQTEDGSLSARTIQRGLSDVDQARMPKVIDITDGTLMQCQRCYEILHFKGLGEGTVQAEPGMYRAEV